MSNRTAWTAGNGQGLSYGTLINSADMASMTNGQTVVGTPTITNGSALDMFMDISYLLTIASNTIVVGAAFAFWFYNLNQDGTHYGDNQGTVGTASSFTPSFPAFV